MQAYRFVVWDIGATKCAAAIVDYQAETFNIYKQCRFKLREFLTLDDLTDAIEQQLNIHMCEADAICIAGAGQYNGEELILDKGYPYPIYLASLAKQRHWNNFFVVHDYTPIVCRTFIEDEQNIQTIHAGAVKPYGRRVALGVGTGLGLKDAIKLPNHHIWIGTNEMGHIGLAHPPIYQMKEFMQHLELIHFMQQHSQHSMLPITFESILSGPGLALLHQFANKLPQALTPEETTQAIYASCNFASLELFAQYLGLFFGVIQLAFMPSGGIWITGGVIQRHLNLFFEPSLLSHFKRGIALSPAYKSERQSFPLKLMVGYEHAFLGGAYFLAQQLRQQIWS